MSLRTFGPDTGREMIADRVGNQKSGVLGPSIVTFDEANFLFA